MLTVLLKFVYKAFHGKLQIAQLGEICIVSLIQYKERIVQICYVNEYQLLNERGEVFQKEKDFSLFVKK